MSKKIEKRLDAVRLDEEWLKWLKDLENAPRKVRASVIRASMEWIEDPTHKAVKRYKEEVAHKEDIINLQDPSKRAKFYENSI